MSITKAAKMIPLGVRRLNGRMSHPGAPDKEGALGVFRTPFVNGQYMVDVASRSRFGALHWVALDPADPRYKLAIRDAVKNWEDAANWADDNGDAVFRIRNEGDSTYYRPTSESADRAACECLRHYGRGCRGTIETKTKNGWQLVARFLYGYGIKEI